MARAIVQPTVSAAFAHILGCTTQNKDDLSHVSAQSQVYIYIYTYQYLSVYIYTSIYPSISLSLSLSI